MMLQKYFVNFRKFRINCILPKLLYEYHCRKGISPNTELNLIRSMICAVIDSTFSVGTEENYDIINTIIEECSRILRNFCAQGPNIQENIVNISQNSRLFNAIVIILRNDGNLFANNSRKMCWQFLANLIVQNSLAQKHVWNECSEILLLTWKCPCESGFPIEYCMILYNIFLGGTITMQCKTILGILLNCYNIGEETKGHNMTNDFSHIFLEHLISKERFIVSAFAKLNSEQRLTFLHYISCHMNSSQHDLLHPQLIHYICSEFKKKSDCILKTVSSYVESIEPREVIQLLDIIAKASSDERYAHTLSNDGSLFLNVGCLLKNINQFGKTVGDDESNVFTPVHKLGQLAPSSNENADIERDISYELKSTLVRTLGNLAYKNVNNQNLAREMEIMVAVLDSTSLDARNPCKFYNFMKNFI